MHRLELEVPNSKSKSSKKSKSTKESSSSMGMDYAIFDDYEKPVLVAQGNYSKVYSLKSKTEENKYYALKINKCGGNNQINANRPGLPQDLINEIGIMEELDSEYIVKTVKRFYHEE
jgi:hypothetical protein